MTTKAEIFIGSDEPHIKLTVPLADIYFNRDGRLVPSACVHGLSLTGPCPSCHREAVDAGWSEPVSPPNEANSDDLRAMNRFDGYTPPPPPSGPDDLDGGTDPEAA